MEGHSGTRNWGGCLVFGIAGGLASRPIDPNHGISFAKGCKSPARIGDPYQCSYTIDNTNTNTNDAHDTWTITSVVDTVNSPPAGGGPDSSGNLLPTASLTFTGGASCNAGQTLCTIPFGGTISSPGLVSHHTINAGDFTVTDHLLSDNAEVVWNDLCDGTAAADPTPGRRELRPGFLACDGDHERGGQVVNANIQITPSGTNRVGTPHTFTGHVNISCPVTPLGHTCPAGGGFTTARAGTLITFSEASDTATSNFVGGVNTCTTIGTTGECTVQINSPTPGVTTVRATTAVDFGVGANTVTVTRETGDGIGVDGPNAVKTWVERADLDRAERDERGRPAAHVHGHAAEGHRHRRVRRRRRRARRRHADRLERRRRTRAPTGTCTNAGANTNASGQCTITFTSPTPGKVTGARDRRRSSVERLGADHGPDRRRRPATRGDAVKTFVDANIQITPPTATNPVGATHVFTAHVNVNTGDGAAS